MGGRQTVLFMTGPVSALSPASQIPETGKYFNCKHPWLDSLRGPPVRLFHLLLTHLLSRMTRKRVCMTNKTSNTPVYIANIQYLLQLSHKAACTHILELMMLHITTDTCILQLPSKSTVIQISQDTTRCLRAARRREARRGAVNSSN